MNRTYILSTLMLQSIVIFFLGGCQTPAPASAPIQISKIQSRFAGPGDSATHDFVNANNACRNETSYATNGNMPSSSAIPSCDAVLQCLSNKGFYSAPYGKYDPEELGIGISCVAQ